MRRKMTSKRALQKLSYVPIFEDDDSNMITDTCCCVYVGDLCEVYDSEVNIIKKDLDQLEKLKKENQELKEQVNHYKKVIEVMQNPSKLDCTHMFDNCKELKPLTEKKEHKMTSKEGLKLLETRCRFFAQDDDELQETYEAREAIKKDLELLEILKKHYNINSLTTSLDSFISFFIFKTDKDFEKIKEWLDE